MRFRYRIAIFLIVVALLVAGRSFPEIAAWPMALSPFVAVAAMIGGFSFSVPALVVAVPCLFRRRILCRTVCPMGFCFTVIGKLQKRLTGSNRLPKFLRHAPKLGWMLAIFTWLGAGMGVVGFIWLDPFVLFGTPFHWTSLDMGIGDWRYQYVSPLFWFALLLLFIEPILPTFWCRNVCPLGGAQDLLYWPGTVIQKPHTEGQPELKRKRRRDLLKHGFSLLFFGGLFVYLSRHSDSAEPERPPGALDEPTFLALCARCGACIRACPTGMLMTGGGAETSVREIACPIVSFRFGSSAWCKHDCNACSRACPTGAIRKFSIGEKKNIKLGLAELHDFEKCKLYEDVECTICQRDCPYDAVSYEWSDEEYRRIPVIDADLCTGCGRCAVSCPGLGEKEPKPLRMTSLG